MRFWSTCFPWARMLHIFMYLLAFIVLLRIASSFHLTFYFLNNICVCGWCFELFPRWSSCLTPGFMSEEHISIRQRPVHCPIHNSQVMLGCLVLRGKFRVSERSFPGGVVSETSASVAVETLGYWRWQEFTKGDGLCRVELAWCYKTNCVWDGSTGELCLPSLWGPEAMS